MKRKERPLKNLSVKQRKLIAAIAENPDASLKELQAKSGYCSVSKVHDTKKTKTIQMAMKDIIARDRRINRTAVARKIAEGLEATKKTYAQFGGRILDSREDPDFAVRKGYVELVARLAGDLKDTTVHEAGQTLKDVFADDEGLKP